jgi:acetate kinase
VSNIGQQGATLSVTDFGSSDHFTQDVQATDFSQAIDQLIEWTNQQLAGAPLAAIGHRIVHGGPTYYSPTLITDEVMHSLHALEPFDPDHMPLELLLVETLGRMYPGVRQVACFDTAFHHDLPTVSRLLPIPRSYEAKGIRRYGFHGLSYTYLMRALSEAAGDEAANGRVVLAHLGSGASLSAVHYGKSVDTTMGLTPDGGIPMSTRSGDLDPGVSVYLARSENMTPGQFSEVVSKCSGLLGISETTADMKQLLEVAEHDARAKDAVDIFCYNVRKTIGAYAAALGGIDTLVISGGMGEKAPKIRAQICANLDFLGLRLDDERNLRGDAVISADDSRVMVRVIPTDEASVVAEEVTRVLSQS